jgi:hypothetical protein
MRYILYIISVTYELGITNVIIVTNRQLNIDFTLLGKRPSGSATLNIVEQLVEEAIERLLPNPSRPAKATGQP